MVIVMNKDKIKKILDKTDIYVLDEINILEYIDELEQAKEDYIKSLDKLDVLDNRNNKAIEFMNKNIELNNGALSNREELIVSKHDLIRNETSVLNCLLDILRGNDNE